MQKTLKMTIEDIAKFLTRDAIQKQLDNVHCKPRWDRLFYLGKISAYIDIAFTTGTISIEEVQALRHDLNEKESKIRGAII